MHEGRTAQDNNIRRVTFYIAHMALSPLRAGACVKCLPSVTARGTSNWQVDPFWTDRSSAVSNICHDQGSRVPAVSLQEVGSLLKRRNLPKRMYSFALLLCHRPPLFVRPLTRSAASYSQHTEGERMRWRRLGTKKLASFQRSGPSGLVSRALLPLFSGGAICFSRVRQQGGGW